MADTISERINQAAQSGPVGISTPGGTGSMFVYMGRNPSPPRGPAMHADTQPLGARPKVRTAGTPWPEYSKDYVPDNVVSLEDAITQVYSWRDKQYDAWAKVLVENGLLKPGQYNRSDLQEMWKQMVPEAANLYTHGGRKITPQQYVRLWAGMNDVSAGPKTTTSTETSTQNFDDLDARAMANETYAAQLGRAATPEETRALQAGLNAYAQNHPQVTTRTQTVDPNGNSTASTTSRGGISEGGVNQIREDQAKANPKYAEYQAATTYYNALLQGIQAPVDI